VTSKAQFPLSVVIGAVDRITAPLNKARRSIQKTFLPVYKLQRSLVGFSRATGLSTVANQMGTVFGKARDVGAEVGKLTRKLTLMGGAAAAALGLLVRSFTAAGDRILSTSKKLGVGVEWLQEIEYAAGRSGVSADAVAATLGRLSKNIAEAAAGMGGAQVAFDALGVSTRDANGALRSGEDIFDQVTRRLSELESQELRNALASRIFGQRAMELMPLLGEGADGIAALRSRARELGIVMSADAVAGAEELGDSLEDLRAAGGGLRNTFLGELAPTLTSLTKRLTEMVVLWGPKVRAWAEGFAEKLPERLEKLRVKFDEFLATLRVIFSPIRRLADRFGGARVAAVALALILGGPLLLSTISLGVAVGKLIWKISVLGRTLWLASTRGTKFGAALNLMQARMTAALAPVRMLGRAILTRLVASLRLFGTTIWTKVLPAIWAWTAALLANPIFLITYAIIGLIAVLTLLGIHVYKNWEAIKAWFKSGYDAVVGVFSGFADWIGNLFGNAWEAIKNGFSGLIGWLGGKVKWLTGWMPDWMKGAFGIGGALSVESSAAAIAPGIASSHTERKEAHVIVDLNVPPGVVANPRVTGDRGVPLELNTGRMMTSLG
jgi:hypothetical protein